MVLTHAWSSYHPSPELGTKTCEVRGVGFCTSEHYKISLSKCYSKRGEGCSFWHLLILTVISVAGHVLLKMGLNCDWAGSHSGPCTLLCFSLVDLDMKDLYVCSQDYYFSCFTSLFKWVQESPWESLEELATHFNRECWRYCSITVPVKIKQMKLKYFLWLNDLTTLNKCRIAEWVKSK